MTQNANPLAGAFRKPKSYARLLGLDIGAYPEGFIKAANELQEIGVKAMTGQDELLLNNPDAILNGEAIVEVMRSCCPEIEDPTKLLQADVKLLMTHIRKNSFGSETEIESTCPKCDNKMTLVLDLDGVIGSATQFVDGVEKVQLDDGLSVTLRPKTFEEYRKILYRGFKEMQSIKALANPDIDEESRLKQFGKMFNDMADLNYDMTVGSVLAVEYNGQLVDDKTYISEFIAELDMTGAKALKDAIDVLDQVGVHAEIPTQCTNEKCKHEYKEPVNFDQMTFFTESLERKTKTQ